VTISDTCAEVVKLPLQLCCGTMYPLPVWLSTGIEKNGHLNIVLIFSKIVNASDRNELFQDLHMFVLDPPQRVTL